MAEQPFRGVIIEESLADRSVLDRIRIAKTNVYPVNERHQTPWLAQWTLHDVEIPADQAHAIAEEIARSLDAEHPGSWYADFKSDREHLIVFPDRVFDVTRENTERGYAEVVAYGIEAGIPEYQLDFPRLSARSE